MNKNKKEKKQVFIIDTSAFLSGKPLNFKSENLMITPLISEELSPGGKDYRMFQFLLEKGLQIRSPSKQKIQMVEETSVKTGDVDRLSNADKEILALALEINMNPEKTAVIITDDYSVQNVASALGISFQNLSQRGITKKFKWNWRCRGCGKIFTEQTKICPICGSETTHVIADQKTIK